MLGAMKATNLAALKQYLPFLGMALVVVLQGLQTALGDNTLSMSEALTLVIALLGALLTYVIPRLPGAFQWLKTAVAALLALFTTLVSLGAGVDGITPQEWVAVSLAVLGALGVALTTKYVPVAQPREMTGPVAAPVVVPVELAAAVSTLERKPTSPA